MNYIQTEKNFAFKNQFIKLTSWWKHVSLLSSVLLIFVGLVGLIYLYHLHQLVSWYLAPYLILFLLGTILFKSTRKYLQKQTILKMDLKICLAVPIGLKQGYVYAVFTDGTDRHNQFKMKKISETLETQNLIDTNSKAKRNTILITVPDYEDRLMLRAFPMKAVEQNNTTWKDCIIFPIVWLDNKSVLIKKRQLADFES